MPILNNLCAIFLCSLILDLSPLTAESRLKAVIPNPCSENTLINSVDFHPEKNVFCATYTHSNKIIIYEFDASTNQVKCLQTLENPVAQFREPQHAIFAAGGKKIIAANWSNNRLTIYQEQKNGDFSPQPVCILNCAKPFLHHKFHGISISPCGNCLAIAHGASTNYKKAITLLHLKDQAPYYQLVSMLQMENLGTPKGITFSPDGKSLLVTFSDANCLAVYDLNEQHEINPNPRQIIDGEMYRPEDVKITPKGDYCAVSNSEHNTVSFYPFDSALNCITQNEPKEIIEGLAFPHGLAFSRDGTHMTITEFGPVNISPDGDIFWNKNTPPDSSKISIFEIQL